MSEHIGKTIAQRYEVKALIGKGGMAEVYLATDRLSRGQVALKLMVADAERPDLASRFLRGARLSRRIQHPFVTATYDLGQWGEEQPGHYIAMEFVDGLPLSDLLDVGLDVGAICTLISQVLAALAYVHAHGVLHRDIKPSNIMVYRCKDGSLQTKLTDFGIAASLSQDVGATQLGAGMVVGTPSYMAPEQVKQCGMYAPALDLYAVGTTLYRMMSGNLPFNKTGMALLVARVTDEPAQLVARPGLIVPEALNSLVMKLLSTRPEDRYPTAADVLRVLVRHCEPATMSLEQWQVLFSSPHNVPTISAELAPAELFDFIGATASYSLTTMAAEPGAIRFDVPPVWGRDEFMAQLDPLVSQAEQGKGQVVVFAGDRGIGKSAIMKNAAFALAEQGRFVVLRTAYHTHGGPASGLRYALDQYLGTTGRSTEVVREAIMEFSRRHDDISEQEIDDLVAFLRPRILTNSGTLLEGHNFQFALVLRALRRISQHKPLVLVLDSMEKAGAEALAFVSHLVFANRMEPFPILCLCAYSDCVVDDGFRKGLAKNDKYLGASFHRLTVPPLEPEVMTAGLMQFYQLDCRRAQLITQRSAGNPLFAIHLARSGKDITSPQLPVVHDSSPLIDLPDQLTGVLSMSLDDSLSRTPTPERLREICRCIAILGDNVSVDLLKAYFAELALGVDVDLSLDPLLDVGLLEESPIDDDERVALQPSLLKELLLCETPPGKRRKMELLAATVRQKWANQNLDVEAGAIGDHYESAGHYDDAIQWWCRSMPFEVTLGNPIKGATYGMKALQRMDLSSSDGGKFAIRLGQLLLDIGELSDAMLVLEPIVGSDNVDLSLIAGDLLADVYENAGQGQHWDELIESMTEREQSASADGLRALYRARSMWLNSKGHNEEGYQDAQKALKGAQSDREIQRAAQRVVYCCLPRVDLETGEVAARQALEHSEGHPELRTRSLRALGVVLTWQQKGADAIACLQELIALIERYGILARLPIAWHDLGDAYRIDGQLGAAREAYQKALDASVEMDLMSAEQLIRIKLVICDILEGEMRGLETLVHALIPTAVSTGLGLAEPFGRMLLSWASARTNDLDAAQCEYDAVPQIREMSIDPQFALIMENIAQAFLASPNLVKNPRHKQIAEEALSLAAEFWLRYGQPDASKRCADKLAQMV